MSKFLKPEDPMLRSEAEEVSVDQILSKEIQGIIDLMFEIAGGERTDVNKPHMVGLAAPQIGIPKQIIMVDMETDASRKVFGKLEFFINPKIISCSKKLEMEREGCFSVDGRVRGIVPRADSIKVEAYDRNGNLISFECSGFTARIFQHELDHLSGIRFPERVGEEGTLHWVETDEYLEYREKWQDWPVRCPWNTWLDMKNGKPYDFPS